MCSIKFAKSVQMYIPRFHIHLIKTYTFCTFFFKKKTVASLSHLSSFLLFFTLIGKCILTMPTLKQLLTGLSAAKVEIAWLTLHGVFPCHCTGRLPSLHSRETIVLTLCVKWYHRNHKRQICKQYLHRLKRNQWIHRTSV